MGTPSVVVFGPTSPAEWGPPPDRPQHRALWAGLRGDPHAGRVGEGLLRIGVDDVVGALDDLPRRWVSPGAPHRARRRSRCRAPR